jgi:hypothetical protein
MTEAMREGEFIPRCVHSNTSGPMSGQEDNMLRFLTEEEDKKFEWPENHVLEPEREFHPLIIPSDL